VTLDGSGNEVHSFIADLDPDVVPIETGNSARGTISERQTPGEIRCGCGFTLDPGDCDAAVANLEGQLPTHGDTDIHETYYAIAGSVVAFVCIDYNDLRGVTGTEFGFELVLITNACGRYIAGTYNYEENGSSQNGYMRYTPGLDFCAASDTSSAHHC
jgi:hypothetical protein